MLTAISKQWGPQILAFIEQLPNETNNFPQHVLKLLAKHFKFQKMLIFPYAYASIDLEKRSKRDALSNFVTLNIESKLMIEYGDKVSKFDIFVPKRLPANLKNRKVLFTRDVMSAERYQNTEYYAYMSEQDMGNQACIYLIYQKEVIGNICVFRSVHEPDFTEQERMLMEYLSGAISNQYVVSLQKTGDVLSQEGFQFFFRNSKIGGIMLNSRLTVLMANSTALEHCRLFQNYFSKSKEQAFRSTYQRTLKHEKVQQIIDEVGLDIINNEAGMLSFSTLQEEFHFYCWPIIFINIFGDVETRHLIVSSRIEKKLSDDFYYIYETLTQRESEILRYVLAGSKNDEIAEILHVSIFTIRTHISNIYQKFEVNSRSELLIKANNILDTGETER